METVSVPMTVYFNATQGSRFLGMRDGDRLVPSRVFSGDTFSVSGRPGTLPTLLEDVYRAANAENRPNGQTETSLSVGDVVVAHTPDGDVPFECYMMGFRPISPERWATVEIVDFDPSVMREPD